MTDDSTPSLDAGEGTSPQGATPAGKAAKKTTKPAAAKKTTAKKATAKKSTAKKTTGKTVEKKTTAKKAPAKKAAARKAPAKKAPAKKATKAATGKAASTPSGAPLEDTAVPDAVPHSEAVAPPLMDSADPATVEAVRARSREAAPPPVIRRPSAEAVARRLALQQAAESGPTEPPGFEPTEADESEALPAPADATQPELDEPDLDEPELAEPEPGATATDVTEPVAADIAEPLPSQPASDGEQLAVPDPATAPRPWLQSYPPGVPAAYPYPDVPLTRLLDDAAKDFPETIAIEFLGRTLTYRQLLEEVDRFAAALQGLGVRKGDRVGLVLPNCPQHIIAIFAALRLGAVVAENNPLYTPQELEHQINDAGCSVLIVLDPVYPKLDSLKGRLRTVKHVIATGLQDYMPALKEVLFPIKYRKDPAVYYNIPPSEGVLRFTDLVEQSPASVAQTPVDARSDLAMLVYTGGTTGVSKGVMLTHYNLVANAFQGRLWVPDVQAGRENILCVMPFFHSYGLTTCLLFGMLSAATLTLLPRFDRDMVLKTIDKQKPTLFPGVPTIYVAINNAPNVRKFDLSSIRACLSGAAPLPIEVAKTFESLTGGKLREGYGLTETSPITHANPIYGKAKVGAIGLPISDTVCTLVDAEDPNVAAAPGEPGELAISGPQVMAGYWNRPDETAQVLRDGWFFTGDIAQMDDEGYFSIVDRKKDMIIAGGYNIYPRDIEEALYAHPKVAKAVVVGLPDEYRGETVKAYIVVKEGQSATSDEIDAFLREQLAAYKVPKLYEFRDSLPETIVGKVLRRVLLEEEKAKQGAGG